MPPAGCPARVNRKVPTAPIRPGPAGAEVQVTHGGKTSRAHAVLVEDPHEVADAYAAMIQRLGWNAAQR